MVGFQVRHIGKQVISAGITNLSTVERLSVNDDGLSP
jgi:hypothetical protein